MKYDTASFGNKIAKLRWKPEDEYLYKFLHKNKHVKTWNEILFLKYDAVSFSNIF